jgi:hypothetical protein
MKITDLRKYESLYLLSKKMGSGNILRSYLQLDENLPLPLGISHGVDMNHLHEAQDISSIEPLHWCYNEAIAKRADGIKQCAHLPHPWIILKELNSRQVPSNELLIIGPPDGKTNNLNLLKSLKKKKINKGDVLIKQRGDIDISKNFWVNEGYGVVTAGSSNDKFYNRLFSLISKYEEVVSCSMSSALIFSAALGKKCSVLEDYLMTTYELSSYANFINFKGSVAPIMLDMIKKGEDVNLINFAENLLGIGYLDQPMEMKNKLLINIEKIKAPIHHHISRPFFLKKLYEIIALKLNKPSLTKMRVIDIMKSISSPKVSIVTKNEISIYLLVMNDLNFSSSTVKYQANITEPGRAID